MKLSATQELELTMHADGVAPWESEHRFHPKRRWRFDYAWPALKLAVEVHGGVFRQGRHNRGQGFTSDREKMNEATLLGWRVLEVTSEQVRSGKALEWIKQLVGSA